MIRITMGWSIIKLEQLNIKVGTERTEINMIKINNVRFYQERRELVFYTSAAHKFWEGSRISSDNIHPLKSDVT